MLSRPPVQSEIAVLCPLITPGSVVVDVGSNQGNFFLSFLDHGCSVISVEPNLRNVFYQRARFADFISAKRLTIYHHGCSDSAEQATLRINDDFQGSISSFDERWPDSFPGCFSHGLKESHQLVLLRELLAPHVPDLKGRFALLKVDTEGFDLKVLRGYFTETSELPLPEFVMSEIHTSSVGEAQAQESVRLLSAQGFDRFRLFVRHGSRVLADSPWLTEQQLLNFQLTSLNAELFGCGRGVRHGNLFATTSLNLAEALNRKYASADLAVPHFATGAC